MSDVILDSKSFQSAVNKISREISYNNKDIREVAIIGIQNKGVFLAKRILTKIAKFAKISKSRIPFGTLDITLYRDDFDDLGSKMPVIKDTVIPFDISRKNIILIDDVLYTGRTVRAALDVLMDFGRPKSIQLAVLIDRGFREVPIEAKYIGINYRSEQLIRVECKETGGVDRVVFIK
jgi:pyrimidine operon attenuation protein/uracil phosphoribosyltransferase